jgi:hypothetical protein
MTSIFLVENRPASYCFLARLIFDTEDEGDTFLRNVGSHTDYGLSQNLTTLNMLFLLWKWIIRP